jgi:hypothetical protein
MLKLEDDHGNCLTVEGLELNIGLENSLGVSY